MENKIENNHQLDINNYITNKEILLGLDTLRQANQAQIDAKASYSPDNYFKTGVKLKRLIDFRHIDFKGRFIKSLIFLVLAILLPILLTNLAKAETRIKDIVKVEGIRDNLLIGYGLVVGLNGTGDRLRNSGFTRESLIGMLQRLGVSATDSNLRTRNIAAVMVTATLPPFSKHGTRIDVRTSTLGDASSLEGGTLLGTPLLAADGEVYAVAQGTIQIGGFQVTGAAQTITQGIPTNGRVANGAIIEKEIDFNFNDMSTIDLSLINPDITTSNRITQVINNYLGSAASEALSPNVVRVYTNGQSPIALLGKIEPLTVEVDTRAKIIVDESTGVIVVGSNVRISNVAVAQGNLSVRITETPEVVQPNPFTNNGEVRVVPRTQIELDAGEDKQLAVIDGEVTLQDLVNGLNALGVTPRDLISILQAIKASGALQAEIEVL